MIIFLCLLFICGLWKMHLPPVFRLISFNPNPLLQKCTSANTITTIFCQLQLFSLCFHRPLTKVVSYALSDKVLNMLEHGCCLSTSTPPTCMPTFQNCIHVLWQMSSSFIKNLISCSWKQTERPRLRQLCVIWDNHTVQLFVLMKCNLWNAVELEPSPCRLKQQFDNIWIQGPMLSSTF